VAFEYGEMSFSGLLHKYKLSNIPETRMDALLSSHVGKTCNVCLYFDDLANTLFCVNLDNNHKTNNTAVIPEMALAVNLLGEILASLGCEPLIIASGRGFHLWCRLAAPVDNYRIHMLMLRSMAKTLYGLHQKGFDHNTIKANFYPDPRTRDTVSLRLFGSDHAKNKVFSRILTPDGLLDEAASWDAFEFHLRNKTTSMEKFSAGYEKISAAF